MRAVARHLGREHEPRRYAGADFEGISDAPGDVLPAEDTIGGGHEWRILGPDPWRRASVSLDGISLEEQT